MAELSKKEKNRVKSTLTQSRLGIFDSKEKMNSESSREHICSIMNRCNPNIQRTLDVLLCGSSNDKEFLKLFRNIDEIGLENIALIAEQYDSNPELFDKIAIRTVFGGTEHMPFRGLIYLLPAIRLSEQLMQVNTGIKPKIEFWFMNGAGVIANAIDREKANDTTSQFIEIANAYIAEFHPSVQGSVRYYVDDTYSSDITQTQEYQDAQTILEERLGLASDLKTSLLNMGERRNASHNTVKYATLHAFTQDGIIDPKLARMTDFYGYGDETDIDSDIIISIGAKPEEKFFKARKLLVRSLPEISFFKPKKTVQYIANIDVPPYSPLKEGELYLDSVIEDPDLIKRARLRDRSSGDELSEYQIPVQKAVETLIRDVNFSRSDKDLIGFIKGIDIGKRKYEIDDVEL